MIVAGFGCRSGAGEDALRAALDAHGAGVTALATLAHKEALLAPLARALNLPLILIDPCAIEGADTPTRSAASLTAYGTGSVAEAVALMAAGPGARLITTRIISSDGQATCALAQGVFA
ncbi:cobalamin biosynthesis protein [Sphingobium chungangianum]